MSAPRGATTCRSTSASSVRADRTGHAGQRPCALFAAAGLSAPSAPAIARNDVTAYNAFMLSHEARMMATLTIRNIDAAVKEQLRVRAARNSRSMEAELRSIISDAVSGQRNREPNLAEAIRRRFEPFGGVDDLEPHPAVTVGEPPAFDR